MFLILLEFIDKSGRVKFILEDTDKHPRKQIDDKEQPVNNKDNNANK